MPETEALRKPAIAHGSLLPDQGGERHFAAIAFLQTRQVLFRQPHRPQPASARFPVLENSIKIEFGEESAPIDF